MLIKQIKIFSAGSKRELEKDVNEWLLKAEPYIFHEEIEEFGDGIIITYIIDNEDHLKQLKEIG